MTSISRYIVKEHIAPFIFSLAVIMFVFVTKFIVQYIGKIFGKGLAYSTIFQFVYLNLAWMLALAVPMAVLIATLMAFGRLSADNEITILKTAGINLYRIIAPALGAAAILTIGMIWYNDQVLPEFNHEARKLSKSISQKKPAFALEAGLYIRQKNFNIYVEEIERPLEKNLTRNSNIVDPPYDDGSEGHDRLKNITIFDSSNPNQQRTVTAKSGYMVFNPEQRKIVFHLFDGQIHEVNTRDYSEYKRFDFRKNNFYLDASNQVYERVTEMQRGDREMSIDTMWAVIHDRQAEKQVQQASINTSLRKLMIPPDSLAQRFSGPASAAKPPPLAGEQLRTATLAGNNRSEAITRDIRNSISKISQMDRIIAKYEVEIYKKYSIPFACIVFVLIGAPLGIRARKGSLGVSVAFSVGFFLLYWVCLIGGEDLADRQLLPPWLAMWMPNIIVGAFGLYNTVRAVRETSFINWQRLPKGLRQFLTGDQ